MFSFVILGCSAIFGAGRVGFSADSGFLYGNKAISNKSKWIVSRLEKILIPFYLAAAPVIIAYSCINGVDLRRILVYLFCIQGEEFVLSDMPFDSFPGIAGLGNLWFLTVILLCYLLTLLIKKIEERFKPRPNIVILVLTAAFVLQSVLAIFSIPCINLNYFIAYFAGYYFAKFAVKSNGRRFALFGIGLFVLAIVARLLGHKYFDENFQGCYLTVVSAASLANAVSLYFIFDHLVNRVAFCHSIAASSAWQGLDKISYFIYLTHGIFLNGVFSIGSWGLSNLLSTLLFAVFTTANALVLYYINKLLSKRLHTKAMT